jgi:signal transduction histidine kinase
VAAIVIDDRSVATLGPLPWPRSRLAEITAAVHRAGSRVVALDLILSEPGEPEGDRALERALAMGPSILAATITDDTRWLVPIPLLGGVERSAHAYGRLEPDGVVRSIPSTMQSDGMSLTAMAVRAAQTLDPSLSVRPGTLIHPAFQPPPHAIPTHSAADLLAGSVAPEALRGRAVFVGISAAGAGDRFVIPAGSDRAPTPGVLVHASIAASILDRRLVVPPSLVSTVMMSVSAIAVLLTLWRRWPRHQVATLLVLILALPAVAMAGAGIGGLLLPVTSVWVAVGLGALLRLGVETSTTSRHADRLVADLVRVLRPGSSSPAPLGLSGRMRNLQILQGEVVRRSELQSVLLSGLEEGVILWTDDGRLLLANRSARELWDEVPDLATLRRRCASSEGSILRCGSRRFETRIRPLEGGSLGVLRDVTAERELESRRREVQRLVSHELRTPLASISGFGEMLEQYDMSRSEVVHAAGLIRGEARRLTEMVSTFLDLEQLGAGRWDAERIPFDLERIVRDRCALLDAAAASRDQNLILNVSHADLEGSPELMARVVDNLVGNALKYSPAGAEVRITLTSDETGVVLEVADDGVGIPTEALAHLGERFYRAPGQEQVGSGLGLSLVYEVIEWHGGQVDVDSVVGRGSRFSVRLPRAA